MKRFKPGKTDKEDRMNFVVYWAEYVRTHPDEDWSRQQKVLIDSQLQSARQFPWTPEAYLRMKGEKRRARPV